MKHIHALLALLALALLLMGCEKVIDVDLNEANPQIVIEANLMAGVHDFQVQVTQTASYFEAAAPTPVEDATVTLTGSDGSSATLSYQANGIYMAPAFEGVPGTQYTLEVTANGTTYTGLSTMPVSVQLDSLYSEFAPAQPPFFPEDGYTLFLVFQDPPVVSNYYRAILTLNGVTTSDYFLIDDELTDGNLVEIPFFGQQFELEDEVSIEFRSLDAPTFQYFETLSELTGGGGGPGGGPGAAAPGNPDNNLSGGALGYFSAWSSDQFSTTIQ